jgi:ATP-binding cassette subfamily B protein
MNLVRLYIRALRFLGPESRRGWILGVTGLMLAAAQFAEPVLFGRIIDALVNAQKQNAPASSASSAARWPRCIRTASPTGAGTRC